MRQLRLSDDVRWRNIDGEVVLVSQRAGEVMGFNDTGSRIVELVAEGRSWDAVVDTLAAEFDAPRAAIDEEAQALAVALVQLGVLEER